jgi:hypothetical protein
MSYPAGTPVRVPQSSYRFFSLETLLALSLFTALTVLLAYPVSVHPGQYSFAQGPDETLGYYLLAWNSHSFVTRPWAIFDANIYYPARFSLAYGENIIGLAFFAAPVIWLTGNLVLAANFVSLSSCVLCGLGAFVLARRLGVATAGAIVCAVIFECAPPRFFRIGQLTLTSVQWIPFALASAHVYLEQGKRRDLRLTAAFVTLQVLSTGYGAVFMAVSLLFFGLFRLLLGEPLRIARRVRDLGITGALLLLPTFLVYLPYPTVQREAGLRRGLGTWLQNYTSFFASPSHAHRWLLETLGLTHLAADASAYLFPGYVATLFAVLALVFHQRDVRRAYLARGSSLTLRLVFGLEIALVGAAAVACWTSIEPFLTGTVLPSDPRPALSAWMVCIVIAAVRAVAFRVSYERFRLMAPAVAVVIACGLGTVGLTAAHAHQRAGHGLRGEYFANGEWQGTPVVSAVDPDVSFERVTGRFPGGAPEYFSVRWTGFLNVGRAGRYTFATTSDDGSALFLDNQPEPLVLNGGVHGVQTATGTTFLEAGPHVVELRYNQLGGVGLVTWEWGPEGGKRSTVPAWVLSPERTTYAETLAGRALVEGRRLMALLAIAALAWTVVRWSAAGARTTIGRWAAEKRRDPVALYAALMLLMFGLTLGPPYGLWRYFYALPIFSFIRISSRFSLVWLLAIGVLAGIGFDRLTRAWTSRGRAMLAGVLTLVLVVEYMAAPLIPGIPRAEVPSIDRYLNTLPKPFVIAEVPALSERDQTDYMVHSTAHWQKTIQGYHGWRSSFHHELNAEMEQFPNAQTLERLTALNVTYVVVHDDRYSPERWAEVKSRLELFSDQLRMVHADATGRIYQLTPAHPPAAND